MLSDLKLIYVEEVEFWFVKNSALGDSNGKILSILICGFFSIRMISLEKTEFRLEFGIRLGFETLSFGTKLDS